MRRKDDRTRPTADEAFRRSWGNGVAIGLIVAVGLHFGLLELFPMLHAENLSTTNRAIEAVPLPPEVRIPPPPKSIARPARPKVADTEVPDDLTMPRTDLTHQSPAELPPPPSAASPSSRPSYIPRDVEPRLENRAEVGRLLERLYPPALRDAGIGGRVVLWLFVDASGEVVRTQVQSSSGYDALDEAAARIASKMEFRPAVSRDRPIGVWIAQPIDFRVRR